MIFVSPLETGMEEGPTTSRADLSFGLGFIHHVFDPQSTEKPKGTNKQTRERKGGENKILRFEAVFAAFNFLCHRPLEGRAPCRGMLISFRVYIEKG